LRKFRSLHMLIVGFGLLLLCLIWTVCFYQISAERQIEISSAIRETGNYALAFNEHMERTILNADQMLLLIKDQYKKDGQDIDMSPYKKNGALWNSTYLLIGIADENGDWIISNQDPHIPSNLKDREHIKVHMQEDTGKLFISKPVIGRSSGKWSINMTRRINKVDGSYGGTVIVGVNPYYFTNFYQKVNLGKNSSIALMGLDGIIRARQSGANEEVGQDLNQTTIMDELAKSSVGSYVTMSTIDHIKRIYSYRVLPNYPFVVIVGVDEAEVLAAWHERVTIYYLVCSVVTIIILLFVIMLLHLTDKQKLIAQKLESELNERRAMQTELVIAKEAAEAANLAKSEFLANMSHEIRTPMNPILGMTEVLLEMESTVRQRELLEIIRSASQSLLDIINDILDFSKIEAGKVRLENIEFDLKMLLDEVTDLIALKAREKGLTLRTDIDPALTPNIYGDPVRLRQVLLNLAGNAIKFTEKGNIIIRAYLSKEQGGNCIRLEIQDTGIGLSVEAQSLLFQPFTQGDGSTTRKYGGTGLGLSISKQLVELMGGRIGVKSREGQGSLFYVTLPVKMSDINQDIVDVEKNTDDDVDKSLAEIAVTSTVESGSRLPIVLLVEDNRANQILAKLLLQKLGYIVRTAVNGIEALKEYQEQPDIILMDCQMPEMDGFEATIEIRNMEKKTGYHIPIIAMTANAMQGDREKCLEVGMDDYLSKPINPKQLQQMVERYV